MRFGSLATVQRARLLSLKLGFVPKTPSQARANPHQTPGPDPVRLCKDRLWVSVFDFLTLRVSLIGQAYKAGYYFSRIFHIHFKKVTYEHQNKDLSVIGSGRHKRSCTKDHSCTGFSLPWLLEKSIIFCRVLAHCKHPNASLKHSTKVQNSSAPEFTGVSQLDKLAVLD